MHRISDVRLPTPLGGDADQRHWIELDDESRILRIEAMAKESAAGGDSWQGDWISPRGVDLQINGGLGLRFPS